MRLTPIQIVLAVAILVIAIGGGLWFRLFYPVATSTFAGFPGTYECEDFGIPDVAHNQLRIAGDMSVEASAPQGTAQAVGRVEPLSRIAARLELNAEIKALPQLMLNPQAEHRVEGEAGFIKIVGMQAGERMYTFECRRKELD